MVDAFWDRQKRPLLKMNHVHLNRFGGCVLFLGVSSRCSCLTPSGTGFCLFSLAGLSAFGLACLGMERERSGSSNQQDATQHEETQLACSDGRCLSSPQPLLLVWWNLNRHAVLCIVQQMWFVLSREVVVCRLERKREKQDGVSFDWTNERGMANG